MPKDRANSKIYYESFQGAVERNRPKIPEVKKRLEEAGVKYVMGAWIDLHGIPKTKPVPMSDFEQLCLGKGPQFAVHSISFVPELSPADSDQVVVPDLDAVYICPWDTSMAIIFSDLYWEDAPYNVCPRQALKRAMREAAQDGYTGHAGVEPEFIVMKYDENGQPVKAFDDDPANGLRPRRQAFGYDVEYSVDSMPYLKDMIDIIEGLGWNLHDVVAEGAYSQFELDFHYTNMLEMSDRLAFLRIVLKEVAKKHGMFVTFMPKPTVGDWRSGAHINMSMQHESRPGENLFETPDGGWSDESRWAVGGLMQHAEAMTAITCPTVNSYNGLVPRVGGFEGGTVTWAPTNITYGFNNRSGPVPSAAEPPLHRKPRLRHDDECLSGHGDAPDLRSQRHQEQDRPGQTHRFRPLFQDRGRTGSSLGIRPSAAHSLERHSSPARGRDGRTRPWVR